MQESIKTLYKPYKRALRGRMAVNVIRLAKSHFNLRTIYAHTQFIYINRKQLDNKDNNKRGAVRR